MPLIPLQILQRQDIIRPPSKVIGANNATETVQRGLPTIPRPSSWRVGLLKSSIWVLWSREQLPPSLMEGVLGTPRHYWGLECVTFSPLHSLFHGTNLQLFLSSCDSHALCCLPFSVTFSCMWVLFVFEMLVTVCHAFWGTTYR